MVLKLPVVACHRMCVDVDAYVDVDADAYADEYLPASMAVSNLATTSDPATPEICDLTLLSTNLDLKLTEVTLKVYVTMVLRLVTLVSDHRGVRAVEAEQTCLDAAVAWTDGADVVTGMSGCD